MAERVGFYRGYRTIYQFFSEITLSPWNPANKASFNLSLPCTPVTAVHFCPAKNGIEMESKPDRLSFIGVYADAGAV
jgi:hypothetical protein